MDTGKNKMVGTRVKKRALRGTLFAVILSGFRETFGSGCHDSRRTGNGDSGRGISGYFRQYGQ